MSVSLLDGVVIVRDGDQEYLPSAEEIFEAVFEKRAGNRVDLTGLQSTGLQFSDEPAAPVILISATNEGTGEPDIRCALAGKARGQTVVAGIREGFTADYIVNAGIWRPLPPGTREAFEKVKASCEIVSDRLTLGQYMGLLHGADGFTVEDLAAGELMAARLAPRLGSPLPPGLAGKPYPYQETGIRWLAFLARHGVGCILADEMGLGKTLQVIATLLSESTAGRSPNLVLCPATLLENWHREITRFAPSLRVRLHAGSRRTGRISELGDSDVTLSSYETMAGDVSLFRAVNWNIVAADEAQNIRNPEARRTLRAKEIPRRLAIAISGTPVENRLRDLWSVTDFVMPGYLGSLRDFTDAHPDTETGATELEPMVSAIMLRRRVADVATDLPARIDVPVALSLDEASIAAYEEIRQKTAEKYPKAAELTALIRLRQFCAHPWAAGKLSDSRTATAVSPKLERCLEILEEIVAANSKALIFTSFNEVSDLLASEIAKRFGIPVNQINGRVPVEERQGMVDAFTAHEGPAVLVLNPKAAGTGLNITAANHVIHYNLEWNPAVEDQASARAYRRGQRLPVTVHRMFYAGTVEEVINERMTRKRDIADRAVVGSAGDADDLADIVKALQRSPATLP